MVVFFRNKSGNLLQKAVKCFLMVKYNVEMSCRSPVEEALLYTVTRESVLQRIASTTARNTFLEEK